MTLEYDYDIDVRPVTVDRLIAFEEVGLISRKARIATLKDEFAASIESLEAQLEKAREVFQFLSKEFDHIVLAQKLQAGDVVRVVCPTCQGTGMRPVDVLSGRVMNTGSAFETLKGKKKAPPELDPALQCPDCKGQRWILMERFKG